MSSVETRTCQNCKQNFPIEPEDFNFYERIKVPPPTFCSDCRFQTRLAFRNNRVFYKRQCGLCGKSMLSLYNPLGPFVVYCHDCWLSDAWDPLAYGRTYDFSAPFFSQFRSLQYAVPRPNLYQTDFINSEYCNYGQHFKQCYLLFGGRNNERIYFGNQIQSSHDCFDVAFSQQLEFCYEVFECRRANKLFFSVYSDDCFDSYYLVDCKGCSNCFGCVNLRNKQYHIFNKPHTKGEYENFLKKAELDSFSAHKNFLKEPLNLFARQPHRYARVFKTVNSTGDDLYETNNVRDTFASWNLEDSRYFFYGGNGSKNCYDVSFQGFGSENLYQIAHGFGGSNMAFGVRNLFNTDTEYNEECHNCMNIFGCEGLRNKQYCILNRKYSEKEYGELVSRITEHMKQMPYIDKKERVYKYGDFFPMELSPFAYNETIAQEYFSLTKEQALGFGFVWKDPEDKNYQITKDENNLPDRIKDIKDDILSDVVGCVHKGECTHQCTTAFKIIREELEFYRKFNLPLPCLCPNCRHYERLAQRNPLKLWHRKCQCAGQKSENGVYANTITHQHGTSHCPNEFETSYSPERPEIVYCEQCYNAEVV